MVDLNYNFECDWLTTRAFNRVKGPGNEVDWLIELSDNKLSNNQWKIGVFRPIEEIVIFMISNDIVKRI